MSVASVAPATGSDAAARGVPRALVVGWLAAFAALEWLAAKSGALTSFGELTTSVSVIECIEIAVLVRLFAASDVRARLSAAEAFATLAGIAAVLLMVNRAAIGNAWIAGTSLIAFYVLCRFGRDAAQRPFAIAFALFFAQYLFSFGPFVWLHNLVANADAAALRGLLAAAGYDMAGAGTIVVHRSANFVVDVNTGCTSSYVLGLVVPGFLILVLGIRGAFRKTDAIFLAALIFLSVCVNLLRLMPIALSREGFLFWHEGFGVSLLAALYAGLIVSASYAATRARRAPVPS